MKVYIYTLAILLTTLLTVSCGSNIDPHRNIAIARGAITDGDYNTALSALDEAGSVMTDTTSSPSALAETAALYCVIDEKMQSENNMDKALHCYELAMRISPDSVKDCFNRLSTDEKCMLDLLDKLLNARHDISEFAEPVDIELSDTTGFAGHDDGEIINDIDIME